MTKSLVGTSTSCTMTSELGQSQSNQSRVMHDSIQIPNENFFLIHFWGYY